MIKKNYTGSARRARNVIWNAAERYDFDPPFMSFFSNGNPDDYMNLIAGLAEKWLDMPRLEAFFLSYGGDRRAEEWDDLLWLGLENCLYEKELPQRPILERLRRERGERFFLEQQSLSREQMEYQSMLTYTQQEARWALSCGRRAPVMTPREKRMAEALRFSGQWDTDRVLEAMEAFLSDFFRWRGGAESAFGPRRPNALHTLLLRREHKRRDKLIVRTGTGEGDHSRAVQQRHAGLGRFRAPGEEEKTYIRELFGPCLRDEREMRILENELCVGVDGYCRLWIVNGALGVGESGEARDVRESALRQRERNLAFWADNAVQIRRNVKALSSQLEAVLAAYFTHLPETARAGRLRPERAYRLPLLGDDRVFVRKGEETDPTVCVDVLLDASQSRMNSQEVLSAEALILTQSLEKTGIPVRVTAFRSLRGYTVLQTLKDWKTADCGGLASYFAGGWNRDALALEALSRLDDDPVLRGRRRVILVLTDASPNDSTPIPAEGFGLDREYEGEAAVRASRDVVRRLRTQGIQVGAVFHANASHLDNVQQIYGHAYVHIRKSSQMAQGICELLLMLLREKDPEG